MKTLLAGDREGFPRKIDALIVLLLVWSRRENMIMYMCSKVSEIDIKGRTVITVGADDDEETF